MWRVKIVVPKWPCLTFSAAMQCWDVKISLCGSRKYPYPPPPPPEDHWKFRWGGGFNGSNFQGVRGVYGKYFPKGDGPRTKHWKQCTIDLKHKSEDMYVVLKQKLVLLAAEMRLTSLALMVLFFFELANTTISRRTAMMCLWNEVETISNGGHTLL